MPQLFWTNYLLDAQDYGIKSTIMYQYNQSAILLDNNGKRSSSKRTKHINIQYFFITDRIKNGELNIEYCPTDEMVADFFTSPLQGNKFLQFRKTIMNLPDWNLPDPRSVLESDLWNISILYSNLLFGFHDQALVP